MMFLEKTADFKWAISTVGKYIDEDLNKLFSRSGRIGTDPY
jgi:hypothetical protein